MEELVLNRKIGEYNQEGFTLQAELYRKISGGEVGSICKVPKFHTYGIRTTTKKKRGRSVTESSHRWEWWRSTESKDNMLHLDDKRRNTMGRAVNHYFAYQYKPDESLVNTN